MSRVWYWNVDTSDYETDPESPRYGDWVRTHFYAVAGQPRMPGDPTSLPHVKCVEQYEAEGPPSKTFAMGEVPYASQADLVTAYNESVVLERLHLNAEPNE